MVDRKMRTGFSWRNLREIDRLENLDVGGRTILKWILRSGMGCMEWVDPAQIGTGGGIS